MKANAYMKSRFVGRQSLGTKDTTQRAAIPEAIKPEPTQEDRAMASTKNVIDHHLKCFDEGDLQGILSDYAPGAVLFTAAGPLRGEDAIRPLFEAMIAEFGKPGATFNLKQQLIEADYAYILWTAETADNVYELGTDTFVVRDGKILAQSFASRMTPKG
jgi:ketosteroid isomerase-like protein